MSLLGAKQTAGEGKNETLEGINGAADSAILPNQCHSPVEERTHVQALDEAQHTDHETIGRPRPSS